MTQAHARCGWCGRLAPFGGLDPGQSGWRVLRAHPSLALQPPPLLCAWFAWSGGEPADGCVAVRRAEVAVVRLLGGPW